MHHYVEVCDIVVFIYLFIVRIYYYLHLLYGDYGQIKVLALYTMKLLYKFKMYTIYIQIITNLCCISFHSILTVTLNA